MINAIEINLKGRTIRHAAQADTHGVGEDGNGDELLRTTAHDIAECLHPIFLRGATELTVRAAMITLLILWEGLCCNVIAN